ncbi:hypothetical protein [Photobacterium leiognathi]|uniref:hypothetical protein n=1 Tax=Photobacterium leiognathi TaxID=553611 RepID=UPI000D153B56|nr:hypothetical protein [Photobacterium leiognathi]PSW58193.1 hypothetical protein C0W50_05450 [Photobacterium leiognathi subsp. mandapamensis]
MKKEQEFYREKTVGLLTNFQLLELSLKMYIGKSYDFIHTLVGDRIHFDFSIEDVENYPLERLLNTFVKLNDNKELHKRLNKLRKLRNYIAHEALLVTIGNNPNMDTLHDKSREFFELEDELSDCLKILVAEFEKLHVKYVANA